MTVYGATSVVKAGLQLDLSLMMDTMLVAT